jgi:DNA polymerase III gamma/tau subunit
MAKNQPKPEDENIEIDVAADEGANTEVTVEAEQVSEPDWKEQFEAAKKQAEEAEARRAEAERLAQARADELERTQRESTKARSEAVSAEMLAIENAIANTEHERADAKQAYKAAMEAGDFDAAAEAQAKLSEVAVKAQRIKEGKAELERRAEAAKAQADPLEQYVAQLSPQSAAWIRKHPETVSDAGKRDLLQRAHYKALGNGIRPDTDEYFQHMDVEMGYAARPSAQDEVDDDPPPVRTPAAPAAPVSRGGAAQAPTARNNVIRLTAAQREIAAACGMTDAEYAKQLLAIQRENGATTH